MKRYIFGALAVLILVWVSIVSAESSWDDSYQDSFMFLMKVGEHVVAALTGRNWNLPEADDEVLINFTDVFVFSNVFGAWLNSGGSTELDITLESANPNSDNYRQITLEGCKAFNFETLEWSGSSQYPGVFKCNFTLELVLGWIDVQNLGVEFPPHNN